MEEDMGGRSLLYIIITTAVVIVPCWKIFSRAGLNPALSLFIFIPVLGWWIAGAILAFSRWPALDASAEGRA